jgi:hypothetical protein
MERLEVLETCRQAREREDGIELLFCFLLVNVLYKIYIYRKEYSNVFGAAGSILFT